MIGKKSPENTTNELKSLQKDLSKMKYYASKSTIRSTRRENTIRNIKAKISIIEIQNQKKKMKTILIYIKCTQKGLINPTLALKEK